METNKVFSGYAHVSGRMESMLSAEELSDCFAAGEAEVSRGAFRALELIGSDAADATFEQVLFHDCLFEDVDFSNSTLTDVRFENCRFISCRMERCWLNRVDFCSCSAPGLSLLKSRITSAFIDDSQLRYANFSEANVRGLRVRTTNLAESSWHAVVLKSAGFSDCDLTGAEFIRTPLSGINLTSCRIGGLVVSQDYRELRGCVIAPEQAVDLIGLLGVHIADD